MTEKEKPPARVKARKGRGTQSKPNEQGKVTTKANTPQDRPGTEHVQAAPPKPDNRTAKDFLTRIAPDGPWALTAIKPDKKQIHGRLFTKEQFADMDSWIADHNGKFNMYYGLKPV